MAEPTDVIDLEQARREAEGKAQLRAEMPRALRAIGLREQEVELLGALDERWPALAKLRAWAADAEGPKRCFATVGGVTGTGKTIAACAVLAEQCRERLKCESFDGWLWRPKRGRYVKASELSRLSYFDDTDVRRLEQLAVVPWLVVDDLGAEWLSDPWRASFLELIDARAAHRVRTIITTNMKSSELGPRYDVRVWRRLQDFGVFLLARKP